MKFQQIEKRLKNNKVVSIRECCCEDAEGLIKTIKEYLSDSECVPLEPDEFNPSIDQESQWIQSFIENDNSLFLIAIYGKQIIGNIDLKGNQRRALKHTAAIGMGMLKEWRNTGLGTALMDCSINWAKQNSLLELLWLQVYGNNSAGISLYKKAGFKENGVQEKFFKNQKNSYFDNITMTLALK
ncbi:MAG: GNAT family N-acetyltransferase [Bacteroidetes bacterium]|nr:GNAT family N-acetyltransferase [Bacteroidota bacterium]HET6245676.1 GNAT family N-acetyltransferase [Bacteroidia bacterium]